MIKPVGERILVQIVNTKNEEIVDGIVVPKSAVGDGLTRAEVVAVSNESKKNIIKGDTVIIKMDTPNTKIIDGDTTYYLIEEQHILAVEE